MADTNGAGDTFATVFMLALMRGARNPGATASWAASRAVMQPQTCKPQCAPLLVRRSRKHPDGLLPLTDWERLQIAVAPLIQRLCQGSGLEHVLNMGWPQLAARVFQGIPFSGPSPQGPAPE